MGSQVARKRESRSAIFDIGAHSRLGLKVAYMDSEELMNRFIRPSHMNPFVIGVAGGSGSGKTSFARGLCKLLGDARATVLSQDSYYKDLSKLFDHDGGRVNFDHPISLEFTLLAEHLRLLKVGQPVEVPIYDFTTHSRRPAHLSFASRPVIVVDGILILAAPELSGLLDLRLFVDTPEGIRFERRLARDTTERGRTAEGVREQFFKQVKPMHDEFVEPSKIKADRVISGVEPYDSVYQDLIAQLIFSEPRFDLVT
jgi:uridine kinase